MQSVLSNDEETILALVTESFPGHVVDPSVVKLNRPEGDIEMLRITLDGQAAAEMERSQIESSAVAPQFLANQLKAELHRQLPHVA